MLKRTRLNEDLIIVIDYNGNTYRTVKTLSMQDYKYVVDVLEAVRYVYGEDKPPMCIYNHIPNNISERYVDCVLANLFSRDENGDIIYPSSIEDMRIVSDLGCFSIE